MEIKLICSGVSGSVAFPAEDIEGIPTPERKYLISEYVVVLSGHSDAVLHHDADVLLSMNGLYRLPTPEEQNAQAQAAQAARTVQEDEPPDVPPDTSQDSGQVQPAQAQQAAPDAGADGTKKKSSGG